jgi:hypothetical protein
MITCQLTGGLGQQLFQVFTTLSYSIHYGISVMFDYVNETTEYESTEGPKMRHTYWNTFFVHIINLTTYALPANSLIDISVFFPYQEPRSDFRELPREISERNMKLVGKYRDYRYFHEKRKYICKLIKLSKMQKMVQNIYGEAGDVSMHFRINPHSREGKEILNLGYYKKALTDLMSRKTIKVVSVFCEKEDNEMVEIQLNILRESFDVEFVKVSDDISDWEQLLLMSCCKNNIIANSCFSWWGAYLNENEDKLVYCREGCPEWIILS